MEKKEMKTEFVVVRELPTQPVNAYKEEDTEFTILTTEEALTHVIKELKEIKKYLNS